MDDLDDIIEIDEDGGEEEATFGSDAARHVALGLAAHALAGKQVLSTYWKAQIRALLGSGYAVRRASVARLHALVRREHRRTRKAFREGFEKAAQRLSPLSARLELSQPAQTLLYLSYLARTDGTLSDISLHVPVSRRADLYVQLVRILGSRDSTWRQVLATGGALTEHGLLSRSRYASMTDMSDFANAFIDLAEVIDSKVAIIPHLLDSALREIKGSEITISQFRHLGTDLEVISGLLASRSHAAQILLSGLPGVGKTQLSRALATETSRSLYEVRAEDSHGEPASGNERFQHYFLAQRLVPNPHKCLIVFDEAEDVFDGEHWAHRASSSERHKGWTTRALDRPQVPTIWITNDVDRIDPAYLRRFDHIVQMGVPPRSVRREMLYSALAEKGVSDALLDRAAESERLSPADIHRAGRVFDIMGNETAKKPDEIAACVLSARPDSAPRNSLRVQPDSVRLPYRTEWINCDIDVPAIIEGLRRRGRGTLGFFGPPGTGKTELAKHIARLLDRPLHLKRASDLLDMYVGGSEKNIAAAFAEAAADDAVLFLDEADSFLRDRSGAARSWEVTQVNELLAQLDACQGIVLLATNFSEHLDPALMRRLNVKANFGYLRPAAVQALCGEILDGGSAIERDRSSQALASVAQLDLAFGDFAAALRNLELSNSSFEVEKLTLALRTELAHRKGKRRAVGFTATN